ncbi:MAG: radical SAM protein [Clostridia bacterium]|nr:radical SAM protein [Clostridia bacterium]
MNKYCNICPNNCGVLRNNSGAGICGVSNQIEIAKYYLHPYEEPIISGTNGSGTIFFCGCSLKCVFCQNYELSRAKTGKIISASELANIFKELEQAGAHNINLVTPAHYVYQIIEALEIYKPKIPIVYNTHSYEKIETLELIDKYVDVYLPDLKFYSPLISKRYTGKEDYFNVASNAILFMLNSKKAVLENGLLKSGVVVRHLILPMCQNDSVEIVNWFEKNNKNGAYFSLMSQYTPYGNIQNFKELNRPITKREYEKVLNSLQNLNEDKVFIQDLNSSSTKFIPEWDF